MKKTQNKQQPILLLNRAFISSPGVDSDLINEQWVANHYRWIVWKLASYEVTYPRLFFGRYFNFNGLTDLHYEVKQRDRCICLK